ncbi:MAG TPA: hypothetical protein VHM30_16425 [Gemmatimonadaceae bacterium]|nr:hypothetical protein [Gemmatimonadaceae bacterium]
MSVLRNGCVLLAIAMLASACTEKLGSGRACPGLCPIEGVGIADTTIQGVVVDSTIFAGPQIGSESRLLLATRTDGLVDLRAVIRFDTLPKTFTYDSSGKAVTDTIRAVFHPELVVIGDSVAPELLPKDSITIAAYDVDTAGVGDTAVAPVAALYRPDRLLGRARFRAEQVADTMRIPLDASILTARVAANGRLRVGIRLESGGNTTVRLGSNTSIHSPRLRYRASASADTSKAADTTYSWFPTSRTPEEDLTTRSMLADYTLVVKGTPTPPPGVFAVGGIRGRRTYLAFNVPKRLLDSTQIVRATLRLTQLPVPAADARDTARLQVLLGTSRTVVTDIAKRVLFHEPVTFNSNGYLVGILSGLQEVRLKTDTTARRAIEVAPILRRWFTVDSTEVPHSVILQLPTEGTELTELWFSSLEGPVADRPSLQITYVPRNAPGIP